MSTSRRILLVDDDAEIRRGVRIRLRAAGYNVVTAGNGEEGLASALSEYPEAVLLDIRMPVMDGLTMLGKLRAQPETIDLPVVVLSANVAEKAKSRALELGARHFMEKPYEAAALIQALEAALATAVRTP